MVVADLSQVGIIEVMEVLRVVTELRVIILKAK